MRKKLSTISPRLYEKFLSREGEKLLIVSRTHWITILPQLVSIILLATATSIVLFGLSFSIEIPSFLLLIGSFAIFTSSILIGWVIIVSWYYHLYIITTRKVLEYRYIPLFRHLLNDVLLDQVRCTEVDVSKNGLVSELFDVGTITITFDRPTHQEEFLLVDIPSPERIGIFLGDTLDHAKYEVSSPVWHREEERKKSFRFTEEIFPKQFVPSSSPI